MQSSLIPERPLIVSPTLAATIGLEEAVMLHVLSECMTHRKLSRRGRLDWVEIDQQTLIDMFPFWAWIDIKRVQSKLSDLGLIQVDAGTGNGDSWWFAINQEQPDDVSPQAASEVAVSGADQSSAPVAAAVPSAAARNQPQRKAGYIAPDWQPGDDWLAMCRQHGIPETFARDQVQSFVLYWRERGESRFSWGNVFYRHVLKQWRHQQARRGGERPSIMHPDWQPDPDAVQILMRDGVSQAFIEDAVAEFVLYWRERGAAEGPWSTRFIEHIRRQWARYRATMGEGGLPRQIPADWQPSADVYDILEMAEIDEAFARRKVPEFVLYWRDSGQAHASWNTRFLQYVKYAWARRPEALKSGLNTANAVDQHGNQSNGQGLEATFRRLTDRSWAE
ncbi:DnaT-like ssDNA-binding domain-containing protein [Pseudohongiella nitratireducens]|nr:DnaT-like ssDNA-binding domain-containing protein [Pseudohongiella nitratireducens]|tara:strand:+ start:684 stop:1859 length:1176 start_codon:yes stop_codon:yes gene_type:complete